MALTAEKLSEFHSLRNVEGLKEFGGIEGLATSLHTDLQRGLTKEQRKQNKKKFGKNKLPEPRIKTLLELIFDGLQDKTLIMLMVAASISLLLGVYENPSTGWIEGTAILIAVFLVVSVSSINDYNKELQFRKLNARKEDKEIKVFRNGEQTIVSIYKIVVGDVICLATGDDVCADGIFITGSNCKCDESSMTGESDLAKKDPKHPFLISGCQVQEGNCVMLTVCVGRYSENGKAKAVLQERNDDDDDNLTPLQHKLTKLADQIGHAGLVAAVLILICLTAKLFYVELTSGKGFGLHMLTDITGYIITAITIVVVAVPEGLPLAVTIALAYSMLKMLDDKNLVRQLTACETMGGASSICSDKTGTLTKNEMTVVKALVCQKKFSNRRLTTISFNEKVMNHLFEGISVNSTASEMITKDGKSRELLGSKTEIALINFIRRFNADFAAIRKQFNNNDYREYPFSSAKKSMSTLISKSVNGNEKKYFLHTKGASEIILARCNRYIDEHGNVHALNEEQNKIVQNQIEIYATKALRTICLAYREFDENEKRSIDWENSEPNDKFILIGMVGIQDPVRDEVPAAVRRCQGAGITVRMITGDNIITARNIAKKCNIITPEDDENEAAIEGPVMRKLSDEELDRILPRLKVMARSSPTDKHRLVKRLRTLGHVVAVTGDGTNDAPALKEADVGFAMGIQGTEVAKEASDIILMDDNFTSIVSAVKWGRNVYDSIRKFLQFQLTVNVVAVVLAFVGAITDDHGHSPLKPVQLLWVNLIMDTMAALALATDPPSDALLLRKPYGRNDNLITRTMWRNVFGQAIYQLIILFSILYYGDKLFAVELHSRHHLTILFNSFVLCQIFNELNSRQLGKSNNIFYRLHKNLICVTVLIFTIIFQYLIVEFGGEFAGTEPLNSKEWLQCTLMGAGSIPWAMVLRSIDVEQQTDSQPTLSLQPNTSNWKQVPTAPKREKSLSESLRRRRKIN
eukprot:TRINITY_DN2167_c0_g1_i6.p1 TRINITY_DN2167_c0_g1~~TRINITY_DN2167_c0_g1_i6.p1  ORF type:complete len:975 (+),score=511.82 TRINITY_DN2167_c0_g1_i6:76-3000(+)